MRSRLWGQYGWTDLYLEIGYLAHIYTLTMYSVVSACSPCHFQCIPFIFVTNITQSKTVGRLTTIFSKRNITFSTLQTQQNQRVLHWFKLIHLSVCPQMVSFPLSNFFQIIQIYFKFARCVSHGMKVWFNVYHIIELIILDNCCLNFYHITIDFWPKWKHRYLNCLCKYQLVQDIWIYNWCKVLIL